MKVAILLLSGLAMSCGAQNALFHIEYAKGFASGPKTVSILGVLKDGIITESAWKSLAPEMSSTFRDERCDAGYGELLRNENHAALSAIEQQARAEGASDELLQMVAPAAAGDFVLVFQVYGHLRTLDGRKPDRPALVAHGGAGEPLSSDVSPVIAAPRAPDLSVSASLFSVHRLRTVAVVSLEYEGSSYDAALRQFAQKLASSLPDMACRGWDWHSLAAVVDRDELGFPIGRARLVPVER